MSNLNTSIGLYESLVSGNFSGIVEIGFDTITTPSEFQVTMGGFELDIPNIQTIADNRILPYKQLSGTSAFIPFTENNGDKVLSATGEGK